ncbi:YihY/virulence factor BrkB family protein [Flavobacterium psychrotrophum]|uniref:YihY/virulence factor BrkB family protein n=1 Tax=Flavobacterium psychrotrophum TaxID=2294119 RepID=UPI000E3194AB|nr:YihY/virulence factor BrkB family protein [Flavobacterium psychrotrophum]
MNVKKTLKDSIGVLQDTVKGFMEDKGLKLSASLAYYTLFSMAPLLLLIISLAGVFFGKDAIEGTVFKELNGLVGNEAAAQIQKIIRNMELSGDTNLSLIISAATLIIGATTVFGEIQDSINMIWKVKAKPKKGWVKLIKDRLLSGSLIVGLGFLLIVSLVVNGALSVFNGMLKQWLPDVSVIFFTILSLIVNLVVLSLIFAVIYKVLPDAKVKWRDVRAGAVFTTLLFLLGRYIIGLYITSSGTASTYGAAGSLIVILLWVYYSAAILFISAEFTRAYAAFKGERILPAEYAVYVEEKETEQPQANVARESNS